MKTKRLNLSDKRSKRKIVAENNKLKTDNALLKVGMALMEFQLQLVISHRVQTTKFAEGGIVLPQNTVKAKT